MTNIKENSFSNIANRLDAILTKFDRKESTDRRYIVLNDEQVLKNKVFICLTEFEYQNIKNLTERGLELLQNFNIEQSNIIASGGSSISEQLAKTIIPHKTFKLPKYSLDINDRIPALYPCYGEKEDKYVVRNGVFKHETAESSYLCAMSIIGNPKYGIIVNLPKDYDFSLIKLYNYE